ncbi:MAG: class I SAM-dependent methyltransferase [Thermoleophilaceae bacterium]|jgi:SAM-dependent methyltransferase
MSDTTPESGARPFERDIAVSGRFLYTGDRLSSRLANARISEAVLAAAVFDGARVIDIGCGDGTYSIELAALARPALVHGVDPAVGAIEVARARAGGGGTVSFEVGSAYALPHAVDAFDVAVLRGVLHHVDRPLDALSEALRVAPTAVAVEPNGLNPGLKVLERWSRYHVEHGERSDPRRRLDGWVAALGASVVRRQWVGFVPMFSPDWYAHAAKRLEPVLERTPLLRAMACAQYVFTACRTPSSGGSPLPGDRREVSDRETHRQSSESEAIERRDQA